MVNLVNMEIDGINLYNLTEDEKDEVEHVIKDIIESTETNKTFRYTSIVVKDDFLSYDEGYRNIIIYIENNGPIHCMGCGPIFSRLTTWVMNFDDDVNPDIYNMTLEYKLYTQRYQQNKQ